MRHGTIGSIWQSAIQIRGGIALGSVPAPRLDLVPRALGQPSHQVLGLVIAFVHRARHIAPELAPGKGPGKSWNDEIYAAKLVSVLKVVEGNGNAKKTP
jgi:hypothetical protein